MPAQRREPDPEGRVAASDPAQFLPTRRMAGRQEPLVPPTFQDALDLDRGRWLVVLGTPAGLLISAVVEDREGFRRAQTGEGVAEELLARSGADVEDGRFAFRRLGHVEPWVGERPIEVDQSNESVIVGDLAVVKRFVWTSSGNQRPTVLPTHLVDAGFEEMPAPLGTAGWRGADGLAPVASITSYLPDARDGWDWYVELVERALEDRSLDAVEPAAELGAITARLHVALATPTDVLPAPREAAGEDTVAAWRRDAEADLDTALSSIGGEEGTRLRGRAEQIREELGGLRSRETAAIPIHGDLHVGQFLRWREGLAVSDLDGDPLGPGTWSGPPARDVASLVQSLDHVGRIVERRRGGSLAGWIREASDACLRAYRDELAGHGASTLLDEQLLRPYRIAQELHEFAYAARYLPGWRYVPDRALAAILDAAP